jgi:hypothetical protein
VVAQTGLLVSVVRERKAVGVLVAVEVAEASLVVLAVRVVMVLSSSCGGRRF